MVLLGAAKFHSAVSGLAEGTLTTAFGVTIIEGAIEWLFKLIVQRVRAAAKADAQRAASTAGGGGGGGGGGGSGDATSATQGSAPAGVPTPHLLGAESFQEFRTGSASSARPSALSQLSSASQHSFVPKRGALTCHCALTHDQVRLRVGRLRVGAHACW